MPAIEFLDRIWRWRWYSLILLATFCGSAGLTWGIIRTNLVFPSVTLLSAEEFEGDGIVDKRLNMFYRYERRRECQTTQLRWIWQWRERAGRRIKFAVPLDMSLIPLTEPEIEGEAKPEELIVSYAMPVGIAPGQWFFVSKSMDYCSAWSAIFGPTFRRTRDIPVTLTFEDGKMIAEPLNSKDRKP